MHQHLDGLFLVGWNIPRILCLVWKPRILCFVWKPRSGVVCLSFFFECNSFIFWLARSDPLWKPRSGLSVYHSFSSAHFLASLQSGSSGHKSVLVDFCETEAGTWETGGNTAAHEKSGTFQKNKKHNYLHDLVLLVLTWPSISCAWLRTGLELTRLDSLSLVSLEYWKLMCREDTLITVNSPAA